MRSLWAGVLLVAVCGCEGVPLPEGQHVQMRMDALADGGRVVPQVYVDLLVLNDTTRVTRLGGVAQAEADARTIIANTNLRWLQGSLPKQVQFVIRRQVSFTTTVPFTIPAGVDPTVLLTNVENWFATQPESGQIGAAVFLTDRAFTGSTVGLAGVGVGCAPNAAAVIHSSSNLSGTGATLAHELGHVMGMQHDGSGNACAPSGFIMEAVSGPTAAVNFSSCSSTYLTAFLTGNPAPRCLRDPGRESSPDAGAGAGGCGDGVVQPGEQCDCGVWCNADPCCNGATCELKGTGTCSAGQACCNAATCLPFAASANVTCRSSRGVCDFAETCAGSAACGSDDTQPQGTACNDGITSTGGRCFDGNCVSRRATCEALGPLFNTTLTECPSSTTTCGTLLCSTGAGCTSLTLSSNPVTVPSGVACAASSQCSGGVCTPSNVIPLLDQCPTDPLKRAPGVCGCGAVDTDSDRDGLPDCLDFCPFSPGTFRVPCGPIVDAGIADAGVPDAGSPVIDAGTPDAGVPRFDAGTNGTDAGTSVVDAGSTGSDAGSATPDAGVITHDAGLTTDGGPVGSDAGLVLADGGSDGGIVGGCGCSSGFDGALALGALVLWRRRARRG